MASLFAFDLASSIGFYCISFLSLSIFFVYETGPVIACDSLDNRLGNVYYLHAISVHRTNGQFTA